jgi:hypothetical protein
MNVQELIAITTRNFNDLTAAGINYVADKAPKYNNGSVTRRLDPLRRRHLRRCGTFSSRSRKYDPNPKYFYFTHNSSIYHTSKQMQITGGFCSTNEILPNFHLVLCSTNAQKCSASARDELKNFLKKLDKLIFYDFETFFQRQTVFYFPFSKLMFFNE